MSDMMRGGPPGGNPMGGGNPQEAVQNMERNRSLLNPADAAMSMQEGKMRPDMTVREFLQTNMGIDVDGPVTQLIEASKRQLQNRTGIGKAANMAQGSGNPVGRPAMVQPGQNPMTPGLDSMIDQMR